MGRIEEAAREIARGQFLYVPAEQHNAVLEFGIACAKWMQNEAAAVARDYDITIDDIIARKIEAID